MGYAVIPGMDAATFVSSSKQNANVMNVSFYDDPPDAVVVEHNLRKLMKSCPKFTYKIVEFAGEYYYQKLHSDLDVATKMALEMAMTNNKDPKTYLQTDEDIDNYCSDFMN